VFVVVVVVVYFVIDSVQKLFDTPSYISNINIMYRKCVPLIVHVLLPVCTQITEPGKFVFHLHNAGYIEVAMKTKYQGKPWNANQWKEQRNNGLPKEKMMELLHLRRFVMNYIRNAYKFLVGKPEGKKTLGT
jgi:hypothetical protein